MRMMRMIMFSVTEFTESKKKRVYTLRNKKKKQYIRFCMYISWQ